MIQVRKLSKSFATRPVLREVDLSVDEGKTLVVLGRSGCGKSVVLKHLIGLMKPDSGQVLVDGEDIIGLPERKLVTVRRKIGMLFQSAALFDSMSVEGNLAFPLLEQGLRDEKEIDARIAEALAQLKSIYAKFSVQGVVVSIDLGELGGFNYESGIVFAAFAKGAADAVARGGRYDEIGKAFGRARPATGFSMDLKAVLPLVPEVPSLGAILAPKIPDADAHREISRLRAAGEVVITRLPGHEQYVHELGCDRELILKAGRWTVAPIKI